MKKVLSNMTARPQNDGERDACKCLQRFVRDLDTGKRVKFMLFTPAMMEDKFEVIVTRNEGLSSKQIACTCGPVLELPSTYSNYERRIYQHSEQRQLMGNGHSVNYCIVVSPLIQQVLMNTHHTIMVEVYVSRSNYPTPHELGRLCMGKMCTVWITMRSVVLRKW